MVSRCPACQGILPGDGPDSDVCQCGTLWGEPPAEPAEPGPDVARCRDCHRPLVEPHSLAYGIGPECRKKRGITPRRRLRIATPPPPRRIPGQTDLLLEPEHAEEAAESVGSHRDRT